MCWLRTGWAHTCNVQPQNHVHTFRYITLPPSCSPPASVGTPRKRPSVERHGDDDPEAEVVRAQIAQMAGQLTHTAGEMNGGRKSRGMCR